MASQFPGAIPVYETGDVTAESHLEWLMMADQLFEAIHWLSAVLFGAGPGVIAEGAPPIPTTALEVSAIDTPDMRVKVDAGAAIISGSLFRLAAEYTTADFSAPATHDRIDTIQARLSDWTVSIKQGVEAETPAAPSVDANCLLLATIYHRVGETAIEDADYSGSTNGYITDGRVYANA